VERRLVHRHREVITASRNVEQIAGFEDEVGERAGGRHARAAQLAAVDAVHREAVEQPAFSAIHMQDEYLVVVAVQIEAVQSTPSRVHIDFRPAAKKRLERLGEAS